MHRAGRVLPAAEPRVPGQAGGRLLRQSFMNVCAAAALPHLHGSLRRAGPSTVRGQQRWRGSARSGWQHDQRQLPACRFNSIFVKADGAPNRSVREQSAASVAVSPQRLAPAHLDFRRLGKRGRGRMFMILGVWFCFCCWRGKLRIRVRLQRKRHAVRRVQLREDRAPRPLVSARASRNILTM